MPQVASFLMATIRKELTLSASPAQVWDVIRDVGVTIQAALG